MINKVDSGLLEEILSAVNDPIDGENWAYLLNNPSDHYIISDHGRVYNQITKSLLETEGGGVGMGLPNLTVAIEVDDGEVMRMNLDYLVAGTFLDRPTVTDQSAGIAVPQIMHLDGNPFNCKASNLSWV